MYIQASENPVWWLQLLKRLFAGDVLAVFANYVTIASLFLTIYIARSISKRSKNNYSFLRRFSEFERTLKKCIATLTESGNNFAASTQEIVDELGRADVTLKKLERLLRGDAQQAVKETRNAIRKHEEDPSNEPKYRFAYNRLQRVVVEINEYKEDINLE